MMVISELLQYTSLSKTVDLDYAYVNENVCCLMLPKQPARLCITELKTEIE